MNEKSIVREARFPADTSATLAIWREFIETAPVDLSYQGNDTEFANLPGKYARPAGCVLLAEYAADVVGCIQMRRITPVICEMKRLYVRPSVQGLGIGRMLAERLILEARLAGYREMRLDVMPQYLAARALYQELGFVEAEPVTFNPEPGAAFLGLGLD